LDEPHAVIESMNWSQQSHLAKLRQTEPGVHETRDAPNLELTLRSVRVNKLLLVCLDGTYPAGC
jgi:hypothetical protein